MKTLPKHLIAYAFAITVLLACSACTGAVGPENGSLVASAFETAGIVAVPPYTRSIYSTNNF